jgi:hypothetical protein
MLSRSDLFHVQAHVACTLASYAGIPGYRRRMVNPASHVPQTLATLEDAPAHTDDMKHTSVCASVALRRMARSSGADDCIMASWSPWKACSKTCGGGVQERLRVVLVGPVSAGRRCPALFQIRPCNPHACGMVPTVSRRFSPSMLSPCLLVPGLPHGATASKPVSPPAPVPLFSKSVHYGDGSRVYLPTPRPTPVPPTPRPTPGVTMLPHRQTQFELHRSISSIIASGRTARDMHSNQSAVKFEEDFCPLGKFEFRTACSPCSKGVFQNTQGAAQCKRCSRGQYAPQNDDAGNTECTLCTTAGTSR